MVMSSVSVDGAHIAAASMDGVGILAGGEYTEANERLAGIHGYETAEDLIGQAWANLYTTANQGLSADKLLMLVREEGEWRGRAFGHERNGNRVPIEVSLRAADDDIVCVVRERTGANGAGRTRRNDQSRGPVHNVPGSVGLSAALVEALDDVIYIVDEEDNVIDWNQRLNERLGYTDEEIVEMSLIDFLPKEYRTLLAEEGTQMVDLPARKREMEVVTKDGERIPYELRGATYTDDISGERYRVGIARDITEREERERELERYETIVETVDDGVYVLNEDLRVDMANERFFEMLAQFGFSRDEVKEMHAHDLVVDEDERAALEAEIERAIDRESHVGSFEMSAELPTGDRVVCESRFRLYPEPDGEHRGCIGILRDITDRKERERQLERQRDELDTLNRINELILAVAQDLFESPMHEEIEQTVCSRLADSDLYQFAWIGTPEIDGERLVPDASAGVDDNFIESITVTTGEGKKGQGPGGRAFRTGTIQVSQDIETDPTFEPWCEAALNHDVRSAAAVPLSYDGTTYGILAVYASRPLAFSQREQRGFEILGEAIGYAINASKTRQLLFAEQVIELEFTLADTEPFLLGVANDLGCSFSIDSYVATGDGNWVLYLTVTDDDAEQFVDVAAEDDRVRTINSIDGGRADKRVALTTESSLLDTISAAGGKVTAASVDRKQGRFTVEVPQSTDVRTFLDQIRAIHSDATLTARTDYERSVTGDSWLGEDRGPTLTDRQRQALEAAFHAGYFEWPRESTAEEVADLLGITRPTFQAHLRKAQRQLLSSFFASMEELDQATE